MLILDSKGWMAMVPCLFAKKEKKAVSLWNIRFDSYSWMFKKSKFSMKTTIWSKDILQLNEHFDYLNSEFYTGEYSMIPASF